jgi:MerR family mercuric resistance operon transcriptional regulator
MATENAERLTIGEVAQAAGVAATTLRYYEREGLLSPTDRSRAGYRLYDDGAVERLEFIRAAQAVGFTLDDIRALLELNGDSPCKEVQALIERRLTEVDVKLADLNRVRSTLADALQRCRKSKKGCAVVADLKRKRGKRRSK